MRLSSALLLSSVLAASNAMAEPVAPPQGAPAPHDQRVSARRDAAGQDQVAVVDPTAADPTHSAPKTYPSYFHERASEANCYYVFGELRCDRVREGPKTTAQK